MTHRLHKLGQYVLGWTAYFYITASTTGWVRAKIKHLPYLGWSLKTAIQHGDSSTSYWHMARTPALQQAMSNARLKAQGFVSIKDLWRKAQGYTS